MKSRIGPFIIAGVAITALISLGFVAMNLVGQKGNRPTVGSQAPDFQLELYKDYRADLPETAQLSALQGKIVVINFWGSWCPECHVEAEALQRVYEKFRGRDVVFLGVDYLDTETEAYRYLTRYAITYANGIDVQQKISTLYRITAAPETFIVGRDGRVSAVIIGGTTEEALSQQLESVLAQ
ncbi:MAG: TlpA disulfide reductase family protein [Chloroflexi bacterium]|nr:TlpA disulfide reductase family protein [Chloroflexota bacterium]